MLKCVFALVVLLHLCEGLNVTLNKEIKDSLITLDRLHKDKKLSITADTVRCPTQIMYTNAVSCVGVFARELKSLLKNVTLHEGGRHTLEALEANLDALAPYPKNDNLCPMTAISNSLTPFRLYATFIRKLNSKKR